MSINNLTTAVTTFAAATHHLTENMLNNETWAWEAYEQVRYAFLETELELRQLAAEVMAARLQAGILPSKAHLILAQHQAAYRDFLALLIGVADEDIDTRPAPNEWHIRRIVQHVHRTERFFLIHILHAHKLHQQGLPLQRPANWQEAAVEFNLIKSVSAEGTLAENWARYDKTHQQVLTTLTPFSEADLLLPSPMWEATHYPIRFRMHRFNSHLREHANQLQKTLVAIDRAPNEAKLLLRQLYGAWAAVEGNLIGTPADFCLAACQALAQQIEARLHSVQTAVSQTAEMITAVTTGDLSHVQTLLQQNPRLVNSCAPDGQFAILKATYGRHWPIVEALVAAGVEMDIFEATAAGQLPKVETMLAEEPEELNAFASDGFTPLQLAAYFAHEDLVHFLLQQGADVHLVSQNDMGLQALHAAVAGGSAAIVKALLAQGADKKATQASGHTPMDTAVANQRDDLITLLQK